MLDMAEGVELQAVVVLNDSDGDSSPNAPVYQAAAAFSETAKVPVIVGRPHQDAEAWFMVGLCDRLHDDEARRCQDLQDQRPSLKANL